MKKTETNRKTTGLKVISVILAVLLWFYVMNQGQLAARQNVLEVELTYSNLAEGLTVDGPNTVSVRLWGVFQEPGDIRASVDLGGLGEGAYRLPVKVDPVPGAMFTSVQPDRVEILVRKTRQHVITIDYEVVQNPPPGNQLLDVVLSPDKCLVRGDDAVVSQVRTVVCQLNLSQAKDLAIYDVPLIARDVNGNLVSAGIRLVPDHVQVFAVVQQRKASRSLEIKPNLVGEPEPGYQLGQVSVEPAALTVVGNEAQVQGITEVQTDPVSLAGKKETWVEPIGVTLPEGLKGYPEKVWLTIEIIKKPVGEEPS